MRLHPEALDHKIFTVWGFCTRLTVCQSPFAWNTLGFQNIFSALVIATSSIIPLPEFEDR